MLYLSDGTWVRKELVPQAEGDPVAEPGAGRGAARDPNAPPRKNNGITGDARRASATLGKRLFDMKVSYAVKQIRGFIPAK
jgi:creatinine amidohydrolase/Fe(II)-dependent formamide hydrolase-like protein